MWWWEDVVAYIRKKFLGNEILSNSSWILPSRGIEREIFVPELGHCIHRKVGMGEGFQDNRERGKVKAKA